MVGKYLMREKLGMIQHHEGTRVWKVLDWSRAGPMELAQFIARRRTFLCISYMGWRECLISHLQVWSTLCINSFSCLKFEGLNASYLLRAYFVCLSVVFQPYLLTPQSIMSFLTLHLTFQWCRKRFFRLWMMLGFSSLVVWLKTRYDEICQSI